MKYTNIQLTDKELWAQFQSLYQSGNYASALHLSLFSKNIVNCNKNMPSNH